MSELGGHALASVLIFFMDFVRYALIYVIFFMDFVRYALTM
jgi:hypothetical protein